MCVGVCMCVWVMCVSVCGMCERYFISLSSLMSPLVLYIHLDDYPIQECADCHQGDDGHGHPKCYQSHDNERKGVCGFCI